MRRRDRAQTLVLAILEAKRFIALDKLNAIENSAAHIARTLKGKMAIGRNRNSVLAVFQARRQQHIFGVTKDIPANRRHAHQGGIEIDKAFLGIVALGPRRSFLLAASGEALAHIANADVQTANRAVADQCEPIAARGLG